MKPILENWRRFLKEDKRVVTAYHGSNVPIKNFSRDHGAQGVMWFSEDRDKIIRGESGALSSKYIMKVELNVDRTTGWQDYDKKFLKQIEDEGYDSIQLDDDWIVFDPARVKVVGIENRLNERNYQKDSEAISIDIEGATIDGVVHHNAERLMNWARKEGVSPEVLQSIELPVAIMKNAFVPEENRGQGVGNQLVQDFMSSAADAGAYTTILIADLGQSQAEGFSLVDWYKGYGFEVVGKDSGGNPVMIMVEGLNERNYQKDSEAIKTHSKRKKKLVGKGKNKTKAAPFTKKASMKRAKSAPPGFGELTEEPEQLELPLPFRLPQEVLKGANEPVLVKNIPMTAITMLKSQGETVLRDILVKMEPSRTEGLPELWYDTSKKQLIVDDGNHRIFQRWLAGEDKFDAMVYGSDWNSQLRSVYPGEEAFDWSEKYRQQ